MSDKTEERAVKLLQLALNPAAHDGEWQNAFARVRGMARNVSELLDLIDQPDESEDTSPPFPFGKYKGFTVLEIWKADPSYLQWVLDSCKTIQPWLRTAILKVTQ